MSEKPEQKGFLRGVAEELGFGEEFDVAQKEFAVVQDEFAAAGIELKKTAWNTMTDAEKLLAQAVIKAEGAWDEFEVNDRLYGSAGGAKLGLVFGLRAGPKGAAVGAAIGGVVGFIYGDDAMRKFRGWRDKHKPDDAVNDQPKSPTDGP